MVVEYLRRNSEQNTAAAWAICGLMCIILVLVGLCPSAHSQISALTPDQTPPIPSAKHDYIHMLNETVNPENGAVNVKINVPVPASRGLTIPFGFEYNSNTVQHLVVSAHGIGSQLDAPIYVSNGGAYSGHGWRYNLPSLNVQLGQTQYTSIQNITYNCGYTGGYVFFDLSGVSHSLPMSAYEPPDTSSPDPAAGSCLYSQFGSGPASTYNASDTKTESILTQQCAAEDLDCNPPIKITDLDGTIFYFPSPSGQAGNGYVSGLPSWIEDRNGNKVLFSVSAQGLTVTDTAGRPEIIMNGFGTTGNTVQISGLSSPYRLTWGATSTTWTPHGTTILQQPNTVIGPNNLPQSASCEPISTQAFPGDSGIKAIELPNGQSYLFDYDSSSGLLQRITYPTGAYVKYVWGTNHASDVLIYSDTNGVSRNCEEIYDTQAVVSRYVYDGQREVQEQDFTYTPTTWIPYPSSSSNFKAWTSKTTTVKTKDLLTGDVSYTVYTYAPDVTDPLVGFPVEASVVTEDGSQNPLETKVETYADPYLPPDTQIYRDGKMISQTTHVYDLFYGGSTPIPCAVSQAPCGSAGTSALNAPAVLSDEITYDKTGTDPTPLIKRVHYDYAQFSPSPVYGGYLGIVDRPSDVITYDGSGNRVAETDYYYDENSLNPIAGLPPGTHDEANYGPTSTTQRGNVTAVTLRCFPGCQDATTQFGYDETGQLASMVDPKKDPTTIFSFSDSPSGGNTAGNSNAYMTQITYPTTGGVQHVLNYQYNYPEGRMTQQVDENSQPTNYKYNDPLLRLTEVQGPPQTSGERPTTTYTYDDSVPSLTASVLLCDASSSPKCPTSKWKTSVNVMDGMWHTIQTQLTSDPSGTIYQDTIYDGRENVQSSSNPYRSTSDPTYGTSTFTYDALHRMLTKTDPSLTTPAPTSRWSYSGNVVTLTDENGNQRQQTSDGAGRLVQVAEANGTSQSPTMLTSYGYDALNNLISVNQLGGSSNTGKSRVRSFSYDSFSRLYSATNPETGTSTYSYLVSGAFCAGDMTLPCSKTDARSITTRFRYDVLNRILAKSFSDGATPSACYAYDTSTNGVGKLSSEWTQKASAGNCPASLPASSSYLTARIISTYDSLGHVLNENQYTPFAAVNNAPYPMTFTYDLAGNLTSSSTGTLPPGMLLSGAPSAPCANGWPEFTSGAFTLVNCYDAAGRLMGVTSNAASGPASLFTVPQTATTSSPGYAPFGGLMNAIYGGNGTTSNAVTVTKSYDDRLRTTGASYLGNTPSTGTNGSAQVTIIGSEQNQ